MGASASPLRGIATAPSGGRVDFRLARNAVITAYRKGRLSRLDVCDAHPELIRAAQHVGTALGRECPICEHAELAEVVYVFGARLPAHGRCVTSAAELKRLCARKDTVVVYAVEVCASCSWNHVTRMEPSGGAHGQPTGLAITAAARRGPFATPGTPAQR